MTQKVDVKALAQLARLDVSDEELVRLEKQIPDILAFVEQIQKVSGDIAETPEHRNIMRDDTDPHETGLHTETLLSAAPKVRDGKIVVKQVVSRTK